MTRASRAAACAGWLILASAQVPSAQQDAMPIFRAGTTLVEFSIVATDENGAPVTDLRSDDITILMNGRPQDVAFFRFEGDAFGTDRVEPPRESIAPGIFTNRPEYFPGPSRNVTAIVLDTLNTATEDQVAVRAQVMQYLRALAPNTRVAVYALGSQLRILHDFTGDLEALRDRIAKQPLEFNLQAVPGDEVTRIQLMEAEHLNDAVESDGDEPVDEEQQAEAERRAEIDKAKGEMARADEYFQEQLQKRRVNQTMAALEALGDHVSGIPGRKSLVWISGGVPIMTQGVRDRWVSDYADQVRGLARRLATQGITVYPVLATALRVGVLETASVAPGSSRGETQSQYLRPLLRENEMRIWATMDMLASVTGGRAIRNTNDLTAGIRATSVDMRGSYSVGFYVPENADNRWRTFDVRVKREGVRVLHREGYMALAPLKKPVNWSESEWHRAMLNPLGSTAIRLDGRAELADGALTVLVQMAADDLYYRRVNGEPVTDLEIGFGERDRREWTRVRRDGAVITIKDNPQQTVRPTIVRFAKTWALEPDTIAVRLIVRDRMTGRFGVLDMPLSHVKR